MGLRAMRGRRSVMGCRSIRSAVTALLILTVTFTFWCKSGPFKPLVISHRGAFGQFPESSLLGFKGAIAQGADFIETDIGVTRDGVLICWHDLTLDAVTNVASCPAFASRRATYQVGKWTMTGFFTVDFTLDEIRSFHVQQRYTYRNKSYNGSPQCRVVTLEELISMVAASPRVVGLDLEVRYTEFVNQHVTWANGTNYEGEIMRVLRYYGYGARYGSKGWTRRPLFIESSDYASLLRFAEHNFSPLIFIFRGDPTKEITEEYLDKVSQYLVGIAADRSFVGPGTVNDLVGRAHARGLLVHVATFQDERWGIDFKNSTRELDYYVRYLHVDGLITDHPTSILRYLYSLFG